MVTRGSMMALAVIFASLATAQAEAPKSEALAFEFTYAEADKAKAGQIPFFRVFPGGKDTAGNDASRSLGTLKSARGTSKLYRDEDIKPGLIVLLRRVVFLPLATGDYKAILEGEFNAVQTVLKKETMAKLLAGETTDLVFESEATKGVRPVAFTIKAKTTMRAALQDGSLNIFGGEGASTITHYALLGKYVYESAPVALGPLDNLAPVYIGRPSKPKLKASGEPETLPVIN